MKHLTAFVIVSVLLCMAGCENVQLAECQDQNAGLQVTIDDLQVQLEQAKSSLEAKDKAIDKLKAENVEAQNTAMQSITTMMQKQAAADKKLKEKLVDKVQQVKVLTAKVAELEKQIADDDDEDDDDGDEDD